MDDQHLVLMDLRGGQGCSNSRSENGETLRNENRMRRKEEWKKRRPICLKAGDLRLRGETQTLSLSSDEHDSIQAVSIFSFAGSILLQSKGS